MTSKTIHKGRACVTLTQDKHRGLPWFCNTPILPPATDILSDKRTVTCFFATTLPVPLGDEVALFNGIATTVKFLNSKGLALKEVNSGSFCQGEGEMACKLSPTAAVVRDPSGELLKSNLGAIFQLGYFRSTRIEHALRRSTNIEKLLEHPATWSHYDDASFLFHVIASTKESCPPLDHLVKKDMNGMFNWATIPAIINEVSKKRAAYNTGQFVDLVRFTRNKLAHFKDSDPAFVKQFGTPEEFLKYINQHAVTSGDLVFSLWEAMNNQVEELKHFWI